ncbi:MAG: lycopene cyclase family protein [Methylococcales bacterium]
MASVSINPHKIVIVIVGGGAAGLELASALGEKIRKDPSIEVTLVDASHTHVWKPLLHEVAADSHELDGERPNTSSSLELNRRQETQRRKYIESK